MAVAWTKAALALMPRVITRRSVIKGVPRRFKEQYPEGAKTSHLGEPYSKIHRELAGLNLETCSREEVDAIIGNDSWTSLRCDVCDCDRDAVVSVPREYSEAISICAECGRGVLSVFEEQN